MIRWAKGLVWMAAAYLLAFTEDPCVDLGGDDD